MRKIFKELSKKEGTDKRKKMEALKKKVYTHPKITFGERIH